MSRYRGARRTARFNTALAMVLVVAASYWLGARLAWAARPELLGELRYGEGEILVHYATTGVDAVPLRDDNDDGVPDFVAQVAQTADLALGHLRQLGFRRPLSDAIEGGDARVDLYLRNLQNADGNAGIDRCSAGTCVGYAVVDNDFAGFTYETLTEGIRSVVPHELFHLVQLAYSDAQPAAWVEGSAVWAVEELFGSGNSDFERFLPAFLPRSFRPLERRGGGFGDGYPYGAALWPYFLSHRYSPALIVAAWTASEAATFLDAIADALVARGTSLEAEFVAMTRWNLFTGKRAGGGGYPDASAWPMVAMEPELTSSSEIFIEGMSARYVPITVVGRDQEVRLTPGAGIRVAAWVIADGGSLADGVALDPVLDPVLDPGSQSAAATLAPGQYTLVVTGLSRNTLTTAVTLELRQPSLDQPGQTDEQGSGGCQATGSSIGWPLALAILVVGWPRRRGLSSL